AALEQEVGELAHELLEVQVLPELADVAVVPNGGHGGDLLSSTASSFCGAVPAARGRAPRRYGARERRSPGRRSGRSSSAPTAPRAPPPPPRPRAARGPWAGRPRARCARGPRARA